MNIVIIDNYDSFTYNLYQLVAGLPGCHVRVIKNDEMNYHEFAQLQADAVILSPGPGHPGREQDFALCRDVLASWSKPILGVCLGHQGLAHFYGAEVVRDRFPMHGRLSSVVHEGHALFDRIPSQFDVIRYHSLTIDPQTLPDSLEVIARASDGSIMAIAHKTEPYYGVQFHPESIGSEYGQQLLQNFIALAKRAHAATLSLTLHVQCVDKAPDTLSCFQQLYAHDEYAVWLDSSRVDAQARFSIMGDINGPRAYRLSYDLSKRETLRVDHQQTNVLAQSVFDVIQTTLQGMTVMPSCSIPFEFHGGFVGYLGYELGVETLGVPMQQDNQPASEFLFLDRFIVFDHQTHSTYIACLDEANLCQDNSQWCAQVLTVLARSHVNAEAVSATDMSSGQHADAQLLYSRASYLSKIQTCQDAIRAGDSYELCLTNQWRRSCKNWSMWHYYQLLRLQSPTPYAAFMQFGKRCIASASMERFVHVDANKVIETKPIKGTLPRHADPEIDAEYAVQLQQDEKFYSENMMIVDLLRNDLGRVCDIGSVQVTRLMHVESYAHVHQLVSTVQGRLRADVDAVDAVWAMFPGGSVTGAPKKRSVSILQQLESVPRGVYTGCLGYFSLNGCADFNIVIRTLVQDDEQLSLGVGGAIIALSDPEQEYDEMLLKAQSSLRTMALIDSKVHGA